MSKWRFLALVFGLAMALPSWTSAQSFEGTVTQRTIEVDEQALFDLFLSEADEPDFETEEDWIRYTARRLFESPLGELHKTDGVQVQEFTLWVKGSKARFDQGGMGEDTYTIIDAKSRTTWMVIPSQRSYIEISAEDVESATGDAERMAEEMMKKMGIDPEDLEQYDEEYDEEYDDEDYQEEGVFTGFKPEVRPLGSTKDVNGFFVTGQEAVAGFEIAVGWCAEDGQGLVGTMESLAALSGFDEEEEDEFGPDEGPSAQDLLCEGKLPVRVQIFSAAGWGQTYTVDEILAIEKTSVPDDRFLIPAGFAEKKLSDFWR